MMSSRAAKDDDDDDDDEIEGNAADLVDLQSEVSLKASRPFPLFVYSTGDNVGGMGYCDV